MGLRQHPGQQWIACDDRDRRGSRATPFRYGREARRILGRLHGAWKLLPAVRRHSLPIQRVCPGARRQGQRLFDGRIRTNRDQRALIREVRPRASARRETDRHARSHLCLDGSHVASLTVPALGVIHEREDLRRETLHFLTLRARLQQQQINADALQGTHLVRHLIRRAYEAGAQAAVRNAVVLERYLGLQLRTLDEVLIARITAGARAYIGYPGELLLYVGVAVANDGVSGDTEPERRKLGMLRPARAHVFDLRGEGLGRVAVHAIGVALARDQVLRGGRFPARLARGPGPPNGRRSEP